MSKSISHMPFLVTWSQRSVPSKRHSAMFQLKMATSFTEAILVLRKGTIFKAGRNCGFYINRFKFPVTQGLYILSQVSQTRTTGPQLYELEAKYWNTLRPYVKTVTKSWKRRQKGKSLTLQYVLRFQAFNITTVNKMIDSFDLSVRPCSSPINIYSNYAGISL